MRTADCELRGTRAFTLMEVLLVVVLLAMLAAIVWPNFEAIGQSDRIDESVQRQKALIGMCRAQAMNETRRYRITLKPDGSLQLSRQKDPLTAPETYVLVGDGWADVEWLLKDVWVDAVLPLPLGPPPLNVQDEQFQLSEEELIPARLEQAYHIEFEPDGSSSSALWVLRDVRGQGRQITLDGRLGRIDVAPLEPLPEDEVSRPTATGSEDEAPLETERVSP